MKADSNSKVPHRWNFRRKSQNPNILLQDDGEGNWLVSYADMMTLLFCFFVIISSFSTPDAGKLEALKSEVANSLNVKYENPLKEVADELQRLLGELKLGKEIEMTLNSEGIELNIDGTLFFDSASAELKPEAVLVLNPLSQTLSKYSERIMLWVEGHTDDNPITTPRFPSNWELSASRASTVVRLFEQNGFNHSQMRPVGLSDISPKAPNRGPAGEVILENQAKNRRIVIKIKNLLANAVNGSISPLQSDRS